MCCLQHPERLTRCFVSLSLFFLIEREAMSNNLCFITEDYLDMLHMSGSLEVLLKQVCDFSPFISHYLVTVKCLTLVSGSYYLLITQFSQHTVIRGVVQYLVKRKGVITQPQKADELLRQGSEVVLLILPLESKFLLMVFTNKY